jgi:hypothetical protein
VISNPVFVLLRTSRALRTSSCACCSAANWPVISAFFTNLHAASACCVLQNIEILSLAQYQAYRTVRELLLILYSSLRVLTS